MPDCVVLTTTILSPDPLSLRACANPKSSVDVARGSGEECCALSAMGPDIHEHTAYPAKAIETWDAKQRHRNAESGCVSNGSRVRRAALENED